MVPSTSGQGDGVISFSVFEKSFALSLNARLLGGIPSFLLSAWWTKKFHTRTARWCQGKAGCWTKQTSWVMRVLLVVQDRWRSRAKREVDVDVESELEGCGSEDGHDGWGQGVAGLPATTLSVIVAKQAQLAP